MTIYSGHRGAKSIQFFDQGAYCIGELLKNVGQELASNHCFYTHVNRGGIVQPASQSWADVRLTTPFGQRIVNDSSRGILYLGYISTLEEALILAETAQLTHPDLPVVGIGFGKLQIKSSQEHSMSDLTWARLLGERGIGYFPLRACVTEFLPA